MILGHINLDKTISKNGEHFIALVEALDRQGVSQHVIVQNESLAKRLGAYERVTVGPTTNSAVIAYCLMPRVDVVHCHDERAAQAGLLLALTRSMLFVLTWRMAFHPSYQPLTGSIVRRAAGLICTSDAASRALSTMCFGTPIDVINDIARAETTDIDATSNRIAAEHTRVYYQALETVHIPAMLL